MKLGPYLKSIAVKRYIFARQIGVSQSMVTDICNDAVWPSRAVWQRIYLATHGQVTPVDHLPDTTSPQQETANG